MSFDALLGNDTIKARLSSALSNRRLSHCFLITGPVGSGKHTLARLLSAAMQCTQETKPCLQCSQCRKVLDGMHPDIIHVTDSDRKAVSVKIVREACADLYIRPNEGNRKIYLFDQELNPQGQNALLKSIEEPPPYGSFLLLTQHAEQMLPTIRSRCVELRLSRCRRVCFERSFPNAFRIRTPRQLPPRSFAPADTSVRPSRFWRNRRRFCPNPKRLRRPCAAERKPPCSGCSFPWRISSATSFALFCRSGTVCFLLPPPVSAVCLPSVRRPKKSQIPGPPQRCFPCWTASVMPWSCWKPMSAESTSAECSPLH